MTDDDEEEEDEAAAAAVAPVSVESRQNFVETSWVEGVSEEIEFVTCTHTSHHIHSHTSHTGTRHAVTYTHDLLGGNELMR